MLAEFLWNMEDIVSFVQSISLDNLLMLQSELMVGIAVCCESDSPLPTPRSLVGFDRRNADQIRRHPIWHYSGKIDSNMNHFRALFL